MDVSTAAISLLNGVSYGLLLFMLSSGLTLIFSMMGVLNFAHASFYMVGAYIAYTISQAVGFWWGLLFAPLAVAVLGALFEKNVLRKVHKFGHVPELLVTFGLLMIIDDVIRFLWGPYPLSASVLFENFGSLAVGDTLYPTYNFLVIAVGALAAIFLWAFIYRTRFGVVLRATSQDMRMSQALGVNVNRVYVQAFTLGCFMAGLGGAIIVPSQSAVLGMGVDALILSFIVVVIGGLGSLEGALLGALIVGVVREAGITWFPEVELAVLYLMAAAVLLVRPAGLFGRA